MSHCCCSWFTKSSVTLCDPMDCNPLDCQTSLSSNISRVCSNSCPLHWWCYITMSSSVVPFSFCLQSYPASGPFPVSQPFTSGGQSIRASASILPMNIQDFPLGLIGWISLLSKGLSRVFSNTTLQKHQFFGAQLSSQLSSTLTSIHDHRKNHSLD